MLAKISPLPTELKVPNISPSLQIWQCVSFYPPHSHTLYDNIYIFRTGFPVSKQEKRSKTNGPSILDSSSSRASANNPREFFGDSPSTSTQLITGKRVVYCHEFNTSTHGSWLSLLLLHYGLLVEAEAIALLSFDIFLKLAC